MLVLRIYWVRWDSPKHWVKGVVNISYPSVKFAGSGYTDKFNIYFDFLSLKICLGDDNCLKIIQMIMNNLPSQATASTACYFGKISSDMATRYG
jgi:hypothetical protein